MKDALYNSQLSKIELAFIVLIVVFQRYLQRYLPDVTGKRYGMAVLPSMTTGLFWSGAVILAQPALPAHSAPMSLQGPAQVTPMYMKRVLAALPQPSYAAPLALLLAQRDDGHNIRRKTEYQHNTSASQDRLILFHNRQIEGG